jgi:hypothetical protein
MKPRLLLPLLGWVLGAYVAQIHAAERRIISLDGEWQLGVGSLVGGISGRTENQR